MTENKELCEVNFENQVERSKDNCHEKQNSELTFANIIEQQDIICYRCKDGIKS